MCKLILENGYNCLKIGHINIKICKYFRRQKIEEELRMEIINIKHMLEEQSQKINMLNYEKDDSFNKINNFIMSIWNLRGATDELIYILELYGFGIEKLNKDSQLIYLSCLLEKGMKEKTKVGLKQYQTNYGLDGIEEFLPLSFFAYSVEISNSKIRKAAELWKCMKNSKEEFNSYIKDRKLSIVGNSDNVLGRREGEKIESGDIVFRMNTFNLKMENRSDLGERTDVFVDNSNFATLYHKNHKQMQKYKWCVIPYDFWHIKLSQFTVCEDFLNSFNSFIKEGYTNFVCVDAEDSIELKERLGVTSPSVGIMLLWMIYKKCGKLEREWIFGFNEEVKKEGVYVNCVKDTSIDKNSQINRANEDNFIEDDNRTNYFLNNPIYKYGHMFNKELFFRNQLLKINHERSNIN